MEKERPKYEITCFISSPFAERFKKIHQVLSENVSKRVEGTSNNQQIAEVL